jgi:predicted NBD/HSP70 family sugar kinase
MRDSDNLASIEDFPIRDKMTRRLGTPAILENDANAADVLVLLTPGTRIEAGIVANGRFLTAVRHGAASPGHIARFPGLPRANF